MKIHFVANRIFQLMCVRRSLRRLNSITPALGMGLVSAFFLLLLAPLPCLAANYIPDAKLLASDGAAWNQIGGAVAISGDTAVVGTELNGIQAAYVYRYNGGQWVQEDKLTASGGAAGDRFGESVAISGDTIVVGAYGDAGTYGSNYGAAYVFRRSGTSWVQEDKLTASDGTKDDYFGFSVAISGDTIAVGAYYDYAGVGLGAGSVYVYRYNGASWGDEVRLNASDATGNDYFGYAVALDGDTLVVGAWGDDDAANYAGAAYVFHYDGANWGAEEKLSASDGAANDYLGGTVAVSGDTVVVGFTWPVGYTQPPREAVYVFRYDGASWGEEDILTASDGLVGDMFGGTVAVSGDTVLVGASSKRQEGGAQAYYAGAAYVFWHDGTSWVEETKLAAPDAEGYDLLGTAVALAGRTAVVGVPGDDDKGNSSGSALVFGLTPRPDAKLIADDGEANDNFGDSVAISGDTVLVGSPQDDDVGNVSGSAYLFSYDGENWIDEDKLTASDGANDDRFGTSVGLDGDIAIIGSPGSGSIDLGEETIYGPGAAYVFRYGGAIWSQERKLTAIDGASGASQDLFGYSVAISGNTVVVGAPGSGWIDGTEWTNGSGAAYVFWYNGANWVSQGKLSPPELEPDDEFGSAVSISGDTIVVGSHFDDDRGIDAGAAYVFHFNGSIWVEENKLTAGDGELDDEFGFSVANSSDTIAVGSIRDDSMGAAYVFGYDGENWIEEDKLTASDGALSVVNPRFGFSVAISSANTIIVGAEFHDYKGSAYVFWHDETSWIEEPKLIAPDLGTDWYGTSVAISGDTVVVGSPYTNGVVDDTGAAYLSIVEYVNVPEPSMLALNIAALAALAFVARRRASP